MTFLVLGNAMDHPPFVIAIQKFLGAKMFIFASLNKLWRGLYVKKTGNVRNDYNNKVTRAIDMLDSVSLLELASDYGLDLENFYMFSPSIQYSLTEETKASTHLAWWAGKIAPDEVIIHYRQLSSKIVGHLYNGAAYNGRLEIIKELYEVHGCKFCNDTVCMEAACAPTIDVLKWLNDQNIGTWDVETMINMMIMAARFGHIHIVQWLHEYIGVELLPAVPNAAASNSRLDFLRWMLEKYSWIMSYKTCLNAALAKKPLVLQWLKENNVGQWDKESLQGMLRRAAEGGGIETASWLLDCGAGWDDTIVFAAVDHNQIDFVKWCKREGCPWGDIDCLKVSKSGATDQTFDELHSWKGWDQYKCNCGGCLRGLSGWGGNEMGGYSEFDETDNNDEECCIGRDHPQ